MNSCAGIQKIGRENLGERRDEFSEDANECGRAMRRGGVSFVGNSAGDEGWVRMDVVKFMMGGRRIRERGWG